MLYEIATDASPAQILQFVQQNGAVRLSNLFFEDASALEYFLQTFPIQFGYYQFGQSPRTKCSNWIYTTTEYSPKATIPPHHELSYTSHAPRFLFFYCKQPASSDGQTTLLDGLEFYQEIRNNPLFKPLLKHGLEYHKTMPSQKSSNNQISFGKSWQEHFETRDKYQIEAYLQDNRMTWKWLSNDQLQTQIQRPAIHIHPENQEPCWFAQPSLWHLHCFGKRGEFLMKRLPKEQYPVHVTLGNGEELSPELLNEIENIALRLATPYSWKKGDLLVVDNWRIAHGRHSFTGERIHWIAMGN